MNINWFTGCKNADDLIDRIGYENMVVCHLYNVTVKNPKCFQSDVNEGCLVCNYCNEKIYVEQREINEHIEKEFYNCLRKYIIKHKINNISFRITSHSNTGVTEYSFGKLIFNCCKNIDKYELLEEITKFIEEKTQVLIDVGFTVYSARKISKLLNPFP